ncbi:hypothetical protein L1987_27082 [Smallanthus sonchifolius]|uniref:Uncharacterized protein n=1 Tax=Smallanthus sonchifolius TaxID=185202 RepID=A0ACB9IC23_9ASTR|nr:hypothetical protein L1987_27082 [Smallanthus sonchifolius]
MMKLRKQHSVEPMADKSILRKVVNLRYLSRTGEAISWLSARRNLMWMMSHRFVLHRVNLRLGSLHIGMQKKLRTQHSVESMSDKSILEKVLGRSSVRLHGSGRDPAIASNTMCTTQKSKCTTYDELVNELETLKGKCELWKKY